MKLINVLFSLIIINISVLAQKPTTPITNGVSLQLANARSTRIKNTKYQLHFNIPQNSAAAISGHEKLSFDLANVDDDLQLDFKQPENHIKSLLVNQKAVKINQVNEHIIIAKQFLKKGKNIVEINFIAGNESLNRNTEYLYALFVPDHARQAFPCFDQPDLKAKFVLTLTTAKDWTALSNGKLLNKKEKDGKNSFSFAETELLPTYLFSFTAGKYEIIQKNLSKREMTFLHRETDINKTKASTDSIFLAHQNALQFLEQYTNTPYPFQKIGFVGIPFFQFGGMEHPGEVQYNAASIFLDSTATKDQFIARANLISHETAHMWFGDLVTMKWFNDVWTKEVFANFMADKVTEKMMGTATFNLKFLLDHYPSAYAVDRTLGANPIRQELDNLQDAGSLYGNIIYHKAPIMMRQLELIMGKDNFQSGIREYLKTYAYKNATWDNLIAILSKYTKTDLYAWNKVWVNLPGRAVFDYNMVHNGNKIKSLTLNQQTEIGDAKIWPQSFSITLYYPNSSKTLLVHTNSQTTEILEAKGLEKPLFILFNSDAFGYGLFPVDVNMDEKMFALKNPLERASAYINCYEAMLAGKTFLPKQLLNLFIKGMEAEKNEMNLRLLTNYIGNIYWNFLTLKTREETTMQLEDKLWDLMVKEQAPNNKKILFRTYQSCALSKTADKRLYDIWSEQNPPLGMRLSEDDYTSLAFNIALKSDTPANILKLQSIRIKNQERKDRIAFLTPALSKNATERDNFFNSLKERKNRTKEAWVTAGLAYLHHPLRQETSIKYLRPSLDILEELQKTGDIFFPQSWLGATFGNYQNAEAYAIVTDFLKEHPNYNPKLKAKILQATDYLYRAQSLVKQ